ncbi:MAG TPA: hypothetical protein VFL94_11110 [Actinomycetales bacterium]|nr:hypothetical protein [Actinomycetales bacterium]
MTASQQSSSLLLGEASGTDLATFVGRAQRVDPEGAARLVAAGTTLAAYASPVHGAGGPTVLALRVHSLLRPDEADVTVPLVALADRFARWQRITGPRELALPPSDAGGAAWAGVSPPRSGWTALGTLGTDVLAAEAQRGSEEITRGAPEGSGAAAVARLRALVWGRPLPGVDVPAGSAFVLDAFGFLVPSEPVQVHSHGPWRRLTTSRGYVLSRPALG